MEWTGGDMGKGPGGCMKLRLLNEYINKLDENDIILFSYSYDVVFLSGENEILEKYNIFDKNIVIAAEKYCWPDKSVANKFDNTDSIYKYINIGGFIGDVKSIKSLIFGNYMDNDDDQLLIHNNYFKNKNEIAIDYYCNIFQTSNDDIINEIKIENNRIKNIMYKTNPCHFHGNGNKIVKLNFNNLCNYLLYQNDKIYQYIGIKNCKQENKSIYIFIYIEHDNYCIDRIIHNLYEIDYDKSNILIHFNFRNPNYKKYKEITEYKKVIYTYSDQLNAREESLKNCNDMKFDYYLNYDICCDITNNNIIKDLIKYDKNIICPLLKVNGKYYSNFWGLMNKDYYYSRSFNYFDIINYKSKGCWNCCYINFMYLIKGNIIKDIIHFYKGTQDIDINFCKNLINNNYFMYVVNEEVYGY